MPSRFLIRNAEERDLSDVFRLSRYLDSYNLPADRGRLRRLLRDSQGSFAGTIRDAARQRYLFVLQDTDSGQVVGCSQIIAKHGTPGLPHLYMTSFVERRASRTLHKTVEHKCLRLGFTEDGPTEVGGLVLLPKYRGRPERLGHWLSYVRFLYMAGHPENFQKYLLAEFLPAFLKQGRSPFWEYFGKKFTGLSYHRADRLSIDDKEFILSLFPRGTIYQDFFPREVVKYLGEVGDPTRPAAHLLRKIGFRYLHQIEPFDGGPYYGALTRSVTLIRRAKQLRCRTGTSRKGGKPHLLLAPLNRCLRALVASVPVEGMYLELSSDFLNPLRVKEGEWIWAVPFP